jgi:hypothetical protein
MRVELPQFNERPPFPLYWQGTSLAHWDGEAWEKEDIARKIPRMKGGGITLRQALRDTKAIYQVIMLEPLETDILFCLHPPLEIRGDFSHLLVDDGGGLHLPYPPLGRYVYEVYSSPQQWGKGIERPAAIYLQLPEGNQDLVELALQIVAGASSTEEKVNRVISFLQNNCTYSLDPRRDGRFPPLWDFLMHSREGYCEHFATAAAVLLRGAGVPTRLVCGFAQGEWNSLGRYFMVRQRDAHTWIEAYLPGRGWVPFDPTPVAALQAPTPFVSSLYRYYDFLKLQWNRYIIQYSRRDQIRALLAFRRKVMGLRLFSHASPLHRVEEKHAQPSTYLLTALAALALIMLIAWGFRRRRHALAPAQVAKPPAEISFYLKMLKVLERKKIPKQATETPAEFARRVGSREVILSSWLERITSLYYRVRFGRIPLTLAEAEEAQKIMRDLKKSFSYPYASMKR